MSGNRSEMVERVANEIVEYLSAAIPSAGGVEEIWAALAAKGHVIDDGTWLQCSKDEFRAALGGGQ
jgi:hypothetical protein